MVDFVNRSAGTGRATPPLGRIVLSVHSIAGSARMATNAQTVISTIACRATLADSGPPGPIPVGARRYVVVMPTVQADTIVPVKVSV